MTDVQRVLNNEWGTISVLLATMFIFREVDDNASSQALMVMDGNGVDWIWLQMIAEAIDPKEAAKAAAIEFCVWWLEQAGYSVKLEAQDADDR
jgi:hypothetical protein